MNRERAETHLRLLAEAELRAAVGAGSVTADGGDASYGRMVTVARALADVHALDYETADAILSDHSTALAARQRSDQARRMMRFPSALGQRPWLARRTGGSQIVADPPNLANPGLADPGQALGSGPSGPDRYVPLGLTLWYEHDGLGGEMHLLSYSRTASGARFALAWRITSSAWSGGNPLPSGLFGVTDDKGARYTLAFSGCGGPDCAGEIALCPDPPDDVGWFDVAPPGGPALRVRVNPDRPPHDGSPLVRHTGLSPGEHLLNQTAERLLTAVPDSRPLRLQPLTGIAAGLGDVVDALEAAEALPAASPVPGRLAALCASLGVTGHGITAPPAHHLPELWLSLLAHYQRRKPEEAPAWDGFAAVAAALPELDGIGLALLGLHTTEGRTVLHLRASHTDGSDERLVPDFPLSVWVRDSGGRWHAAQQASGYRDDREYALMLRLVPPLTRATDWIELLVAGPAAEVRAKLPLCWGSPP
jgi:hypothetical protein